MHSNNNLHIYFKTNKMKKLVLLLITIFLWAACTEIVDDKKTPPLAPEDQKVRIEQVAQDLMDKYPAEVFEDFFDLSSRFAEKYLEGDYDWDDFYEYCEDKGEGMYEDTEDEWYENGVDYYEYTIDILVMLSDIQGKLMLGSNSAKCSDYDGLKVLFTLDGKDYEADVTFSGKKTTAYYSYKDVYGRTDSYYGNDYHNEGTYNIQVEVPEKVSIKITEDGKSFVDVTVDFIVSFSKTGVNLTKDCFIVTTTIKIDEHELIISNTGYNASIGKATAECILKKGSEEILSMKLLGDVDVRLVTEEIDPESVSGYYDNDIYPEFSVAKNANISINILDQLQVKGNCNNLLTVEDYVKNLWDASDKSTAERAVDNINNQFDLGLYYDGSSTKQADIVMDYYDGGDWFDLEPILVFPDGSKYAFYEYFEEDAFDGTIDHFELWIEMYETLFDHYYD